MNIILLIASGVLFAVAVAYICIKLLEHWLQSYYRHVKTGEKLPSPTLMQVALRVMFSKAHLAQEIMRIKNQCGDLFHTFVGLSGSSIVVARPALVGKVLRQTQFFPKCNVFTSSQLHEFWGDNVLVVEGDVWKRQRSVMNKGFYDVEKFLGVFAKKISLCLDQWDTMSANMSKKHLGVTTFLQDDKGNPLDSSDQTLESINKSSYLMKVLVRPFMQKMTLDVLGCSIFGYEFHYLEGEKGEYLDAYNYVMGQAFNIFRTLLQIINRLPGWLYPSNKRIYQASEKFDELAYDMIAKAKKRVEEKRNRVDQHCASEDEDINFLEMMIESTAMDENSGERYTALTDKELRDNVCVFFIAGHETTAMVLSFALFALANHPQIQEKARIEVLDLVGKDAIPTYEQLHKLEYINCIINETMRMWPPISILNGRLVKRDEVFDDYKIPKGSLIQIFIYGLHHSKEIWGDPEVFRPERFEPAESKGRPSCSFIPFSSGPRTCIGNTFSMFEMRMFLTMILQRYSILLPKEPQQYPPNFDRFNLVISPTNDLSVVFKKYN